MNRTEMKLHTRQQATIAQLDETKALKRAGLAKLDITIPLSVMERLQAIAREKDTSIEMVAQNLLNNLFNPYAQDEDGLGYAFSDQVEQDAA